MPYKTFSPSRRELFVRSATVLASSQTEWPQWMPRIALGDQQKGPKGDVLICIFLRGGADGLNMIVPFGDQAYYTARPRIHVPRPDDNKADKNQKALNLDGFFGLNPVLAPLYPLFQQHQLVAVHAAGSPNQMGRSHFDSMDFIESGAPASNVLPTGWMGRHLASLDTGTTAPVRGIGWGGAALQYSLRGPVNTLALGSILEYHLKADLRGGSATLDQMLNTLNSLYALDPSALKEYSARTKAVVDLLKKVNIASYVPANSAKYDKSSDFDMALMQTAALIKADAGLEVSAMDVGGWDTHANEQPMLAGAMTTLAKGLATFAADMKDMLNKITIVVMSEFGRRVNENADAGTDHGHGNMMLVMGGNVVNKPVIANWPGLSPDKLNDGDLKVTTDYRAVLSEILTKRLNNQRMDLVFPDYKPQLPGIVK